jgi:hypothetical protein
MRQLGYTRYWCKDPILVSAGIVFNLYGGMKFHYFGREKIVGCAHLCLRPCSVFGAMWEGESFDAEASRRVHKWTRPEYSKGRAAARPSSAK